MPFKGHIHFSKGSKKLSEEIRLRKPWKSYYKTKLVSRCLMFLESIKMSHDNTFVIYKTNLNKNAINFFRGKQEKLRNSFFGNCSESYYQTQLVSRCHIYVFRIQQKWCVQRLWSWIVKKFNSLFEKSKKLSWSKIAIKKTWKNLL